MSTNKKLRIEYVFSLLFAFFLLLGCSGKKVYNETSSELQIVRFDTDLYQYLTSGKSKNILEIHKPFLDEFGKNVIYIGNVDSAGFYDRLKAYFSEPALKGLYKDTQEEFKDLTAINNELSYGIKTLTQHFPSLSPPKLYMHVSGFNQNVIVTGDVLSISVDKYLGADYPLYQSFFYEYQRQLMSKDRIVPDYLLGFLIANFPFKGNASILLDRILYEGKLRYILSLLMPDRQTWEYVGYSQEQYTWCSDNQARIWELILENKHLFPSDYRTTEQYIRNAPHTAFLSAESPGRVGVWLGFQIINSYMKNHSDSSIQELMDMVDYQELLKQSKYKPR